MKRIIIVINKGWEANAAFAAMFNDDFRNSMPGSAALYKGIKINHLNYPWDNEQGSSKPRVSFVKGELRVEIWCLNNVMTPNPDLKDTFYYSRAFQKAKDFHKIMDHSKDEVKLVVAYGTAGVPTEITKNGNIVVGSYVFPFNAGKSPADLTYKNSSIGQLIPSDVKPDFFDQINLGVTSIAMRLFFESAMLTPPSNPSNAFQVIADKNIVAVSDMNVSSYGDFDTCDKAALTAYAGLNTVQVAYSVETTHSLIRLEAGVSNFIFISAVTDRDAYFDNEVTPKSHAQNFSASFNGGVFLTWFVPFLFKYYEI